MAFGVAVLLESVRFCCGRRYLSGDAFGGCASNGVNERSGSCDDKLITEPAREPMTESSFNDGTDEVSDDDVDGEGACPIGLLGATPPLAATLGGAPPCECCRRCGVFWKAYGCTGGADEARYAFCCAICMFLEVGPRREA